MSIDILTFNIRYDGGERGVRSWPRRMAGVRATLRAHRPDLVGIQEATAGQWQDFTVEYKDDSVSVTKPNTTKIQDLVKKFNR